MTLVTGSHWLLDAQRNHYAVGAFNANTLEQLQAIVSAGKAEKAPVTIQISRRASEYLGEGSRLLGMRSVAAMARVAAETSDFPVILHFDHGSDVDVLQAVACGFTSVMFDGSELPFEENIAVTRRLADQVHAAGVCLEAELGEVGRVGVGDESSELTDPAQAEEYVRRTGIDSLAVSLGSLHAMKSKAVQIDLDLLDKIRAVVPVPLVLHGSSGVKDEFVKAGVQKGLCKVNFATQLNQAFTAAIRDYLSAHPDEVDPRKFLVPARLAMQAQVQERMRMLGVSGRAVGA